MRRIVAAASFFRRGKLSALHPERGLLYSRFSSPERTNARAERPLGSIRITGETRIPRDTRMTAASGRQHDAEARTTCWNRDPGEPAAIRPGGSAAHLGSRVATRDRGRRRFLRRALPRSLDRSEDMGCESCGRSAVRRGRDDRRIRHRDVRTRSRPVRRRADLAAVQVSGDSGSAWIGVERGSESSRSRGRDRPGRTGRPGRPGVGSAT